VVCALVWTSVGALAEQPADPLDPENMHVSTVTFGGADPLPTTRTVKHWRGEETNRDNGITYRYNMVGVDPFDPSSPNGSEPIGVDIIPLDVTVDGVELKGSSRADGVLGSPLFNKTNFWRTPRFTLPGGAPAPSHASGYPLFLDTSAELIDATMRAQFNKLGTSYHDDLDAVKLAPVRIDVPRKFGRLGGRPGMVAAEIDLDWFRTQVQNQMGRLHLDPTRLAIFLTRDVFLYLDHDPTRCCVLGAHGAGHAPGGDGGPVRGNGNQPVQTFVWASWLTAGLLVPTDPSKPDVLWVNRDIDILTHEVTEWAMDPFGTNTVQPWQVTNAPQYGCNDELESGDPTFNLGFGVGRINGTGMQNSFDDLLDNGQANPHADGLFHIQEEALLPWFMHVSPNTMSLPKQGSTLGRYTLMGALNLDSQFQKPAPPCDS
jgi:hypothetical protein